MNIRDTRRYEMLVRVRDFGAAHSDLFPPTDVLGQAFARVTDAVGRLTQHATTQASGRGSAREGSTSKASAREALREDVDAIVRTARAIAMSTPGFDNRFSPPKNGTDQALLIQARAFAVDAAPVAAIFITHALPEDFIADLNESIADFEEAIRERQDGRETTIAAQASIEEAMEEGLTAVEFLDAIVPNKLKKDTAMAAVWGNARRIEYRAARGRGEDDEAPAAPVVSSADVAAAGS